MSDSTSDLDELFARLRVLTRNQTPNLRVFVFTSLDLVNSTAFKQRRDDWPSAMDHFYQLATQEFLKGDHFSSRVWKYAGDEVLFRTEIGSPDDLEAIVRRSAEAVARVNQRTAADDSAEGLPRAQRLGVKGTCWVAATNPEGEEAGDGLVGRNRIVRTPYIPVRDFLGPDIDTGFRISKASVRGVLVLSVELALILLESSDESQNSIRRVGYEKLKGVWGERPYPVLWYRANWTHFTTDFDYDEFISSPLLEGARSAAAGGEISAKALRTVLTQVGESEHLLALTEAIRGARTPDPTEDVLPGVAEFHVAAACLHQATRTVLLRRRKGEKDINPGKWDFGCVSTSGQRSFREELISGYARKFDLEIQPVPSERAAPLTDFAFAKGGLIINGVVIASTVASCEATHYKGCDLQWFPVDEDPPLGSVDDAPLVFSRLRELFPA